MDEAQKGTRIISPNVVWNANQREIQQLLLHISEQNNITIKDAAQALQVAIQKVTGGVAP